MYVKVKDVASGDVYILMEKRLCQLYPELSAEKDSKKYKEGLKKFEVRVRVGLGLGLGLGSGLGLGLGSGSGSGDPNPSPRPRPNPSPSALEAGHVGVDDEGEDADRGGDHRVGDPLAPVLVRVRVRVRG